MAIFFFLVLTNIENKLIIHSIEKTKFCDDVAQTGLGGGR